MRKKILSPLLALLACSALAVPPAAKPTVAELIKASAASDWRAPAPESTLVMELSSGVVVIELARDFAPQHVANIVQLTRAGYFDGLAIIRVQDNYVTQWGDAEEDEAKARAKPKDLPHAAPEFDRPLKGLKFVALPEHDEWAPRVGFVDGWPVAANPKTGRAWLTHCYGMVGVARDAEPASGDGSGLYTVIGHAPRQLDLNIAKAGRVLQGMELLSALPRGTGDLGFYEKAEQRVPIKRVRVLADLPAGEAPKLQVMRTDTALFQRVLDARRHRDGWYVQSPERVELCAALPTVRTAP